MQSNVSFSDSFLLEDLIYIPVGNYQPIFNRPYVVNATQDAIEDIIGKLHDTKSPTVTPNIVSGAVDEVLQPSAVAYPTIINSDWISTRRFVFMLKVRTIMTATGMEYNSYIYGYTNYDGISMNGHIDPKMEHRINGVIETNVIELMTPMGVIRKEKLYRIYNVISNNNYEDIYTQRPNDVIENITSFDLEKIINDRSISVNYSANYLNSFDQRALGSTVENNIPTEYLCKLLTAGMMMNKEREIFVDSYHMVSDVSPDARIPEPSIHDNRFIRKLSMASGFRNVRNVFTFEMLMGFDPTIYDRFKLLNITKNYVNPLIAATPEVGDYWSGQDPVTLKAYILIESSVSLALKYGFNRLYFTASNMSNSTGNVEVFISHFNSFMDLEETEFYTLLELFKNKFITEIFIPETNAGTIDMHMEAYIDIFGTSKIHLKYHSFPDNWYTIPTFANSNFSPVVTPDKETMMYSINQMGNLINTISMNAHSSNSYQFY